MKRALASASLIMKPEGYADGLLPSIKPLDGSGDFTFSRGSNLTATRVNADGLIEKGRENLLTYSNQFDNSAWLNNGSTKTSGQSGYDGSLDAWLLESPNNGQSSINQSVSQSGVQTASVYAKAGTTDWMFLYLVGSPDKSAWFNLGNGTLGNTTGIDSSIESVGNGWYRCSVSYNVTISSIRIYVSDGNNNVNSSLGSNIYIQNAQLEVGLAATDYIETGATTATAGVLENEPRLDYSGGATSPSLLLEPQRVNLIKQSEYFDSWTKIGSPTLTTNYGISPDGQRNSTRFESVSDRIYTNVGSIAANETFSIYMRGTGIPRITLGNTNSFNQSITSEWQRYEFKTTQAGTNDAVQIRAYGSEVDMEIWGAQYEAASYPTSYIPNHSGGTVTRTQELCELSTGGVNETEGTFFIDYGDSPNVNALFASSTSHNTITNNIRLSQGQLYIRNGGGNLIIANVTTPDSGKLALKYSISGVKIFANGGSTPIYESTTSITFDGPIDYVRLGSRVNDVSVEEFRPKQFLIFQEALSDADCIALTKI